MALRQLIYTSELSVPIHKLESELRRIIEVAERKNPQAGITGCLMVSGSRVVQFLEGPPVAVDDLYQKIERDQRHTSVVLLYRDDAMSDKWLSGRVHVALTQELNPFARPHSSIHLGRPLSSTSAFSRPHEELSLPGIRRLAAGARRLLF